MKHCENGRLVVGSDSLSLSLAVSPLFLFLITVSPFLFQLDWIYQISSGSAGILARGSWQTPISFVLRAGFALLYTYPPSLPLPAPGKQCNWDLQQGSSCHGLSRASGWAGAPRLGTISRA